MAQVELPNVSRKHFMSLTDGFPLPQHKAGVIMQMTGYSYYGGDFGKLKKFSEDAHKRFSPDSSLNIPESSPFTRTLNGYETFTLSDCRHNFEEMSNIMIEVHSIGLIPASEWPPQTISLKDLRQNYFIRKNGACRQFDIKLYNALLITKYYPKTVDFIGVAWVSENTFKVYGDVFSSFFGQKMVFHKQGSFQRYSFEQVFKESEPDLIRTIDLSDVDDVNVRLYRDSLSRFSRDKRYNCVLN